MVPEGNWLTVGKLKELLEGVPDDMLVVGWSDYYPGLADSAGVEDWGDNGKFFVVDGNGGEF
ncbi:peptidase [Streptomyces phage Circinus]|uniref:Peptidase n=1 Tax=Streptomyces phage Circinus TaxID=2562189 RepID=A0A4D6E2Y9_9CAUD|nr:peptidase [Streptomyces phage Circinus]